jgi:hypothetical protein
MLFRPRNGGQLESRYFNQSNNGDLPMTHFMKAALIASAALTLAACGSNDRHHSSTSAPRQATSAAETACMAKVNGQYGGNVKSVRVASSEFSQANSLVMVDAVGVLGSAKTERWRCLASNSGSVVELGLAQ